MTECKYCEDVINAANDALKPIDELNQLSDATKRADDAIKSGDVAKISKAKEDLKQDIIKCIRQGVCGAGTATALGVGTIATVGILGIGSGATWKYSEQDDTFYEITPRGEYGTGMPSRVADAYAYLMKTDIPTREYTEGKTKNIQGREHDPTEYMCQNFTIDAVNELIKAGYNAVALSIIGTRSDGYEIHHAIIGIEDESKKTIYTIDPTSGVKMLPGKSMTNALIKSITDPKNYSPLDWVETGRQPVLTTTEKTYKIIDPEKGIISPETTSSELAGKTMIAEDGIPYTIDHVEILGIPKTTQDVQFGWIRTLPQTSEGYISQSTEERMEKLVKEGYEQGNIVDEQARISTLEKDSWVKISSPTLTKMVVTNQ